MAGEAPVTELADVMAIERYNLTRLIDRLEAEGLVERSRASDDGRGACASITESGKMLRKKMWKIYEGAVDELFLSQFDDQQQRFFSDALERAASAARNSAH